MPQRRHTRSLRVLVADDFLDGRELVTEYLTFRGFAVTEATNGTEVLEIARRTLPDVILMDLRMPGVDGWEATRLLKNDPTTQGIFIIAITAHVFEHETTRALESGCDALIAKPFDIVALADALMHVAKNGAAAFNGQGLTLTPRKRGLSRDVDPGLSKQPIAHDVGAEERPAPPDESTSIYDRAP